MQILLWIVLTFLFTSNVILWLVVLAHQQQITRWQGRLPDGTEPLKKKFGGSGPGLSYGEKQAIINEVKKQVIKDQAH